MIKRVHSWSFVYGPFYVSLSTGGSGLVFNYTIYHHANLLKRVADVAKRDDLFPIMRALKQHYQTL
jgi:hypothetical protein